MSSHALDEKRAAAEKSHSKAFEYLQFLENNTIHRPRDVVLFGKVLLEKKAVPSSNRWRLLERVAMCCLQCGDREYAIECYNELRAKFTQDSKRVRILAAMLYESEERFEKALETIDTILNEDNNHMMAHKRKIAIYISQRRDKKAIQHLCRFLETYGNDKEAWKQLLQLYLKIHNYELAKFCIEELMLFGGEDYRLHLELGEILYNMGGNSNLQLALKYFSQSVILGSDDNTRGLWALIMCIRALREGSDRDDWIKKLSSTERELLNTSVNKIMQVYAKHDSPLIDVAQSVLVQFTPRD